MDSTTRKRKGAAGSSQSSTKKQRTKAQPQTKKASKKALRSVGIDSLRWRTSKLPDMVNDAEGFYGLEEVDDIEIVRNADNTVEFVRAPTVRWMNSLGTCLTPFGPENRRRRNGTRAQR